VAQRLLGRDPLEFVERRVEERAARRSEDQSATVARSSPTRHCQIAECSESMGRSQPSGLASGVARVASACAGERPRPRHHQVAAGDERLLVRGRDDLAGVERGEDRPQADHAAGADHDHVDVVARRQLDEAASPPAARCRSGAIAELARAGLSPRRRRGPERSTARRGARVAAGGEGDDRNDGSPARTSTAWRPIEPVEPSSAMPRGRPAAGSAEDADDIEERRPGRRRGTRSTGPAARRGPG
jgi:hypothetical protein